MVLVQRAIQWGIIGVLLFSTVTFYQLYNMIEGDNLKYTNTGQVVKK